jgi:hypothetical protein
MLRFNKKNCFVIGGGKWARVIAGKFSEIGFSVKTVTEFKMKASDINRNSLLSSDVNPDLIYIASKTENHWKDFLLLSQFKCPVWVEKSFYEISNISDNLFLRDTHLIFNYYLFDKRIDSILKTVESKIFIHSFIEKPIKNKIEYCDWISHELSIITRLFLKKKIKSLCITQTSFSMQSGQKYTLFFKVNEIEIEILTEISKYRFREIHFDNLHTFHNYWDGVIQKGKADLNTAIVNMGVLKKPDLLSCSIQSALNSKSSDKIRLNSFLISLQREIFNCVSL